MKTFRMQRKLLYPVNVARNVARSSAQTHYVLPSDIELYPSTNLIPWFFEMLKLKQDHFSTTAREVYVLPIFEIKRGFHPPTNKSEIMQLLHKGDAIPFHYHICKECHIIPNYEQWLQLPVGASLQVFHKAKRKAPFNHWEPIYIGTKNDPPFDERLTWEGLRDKMTQVLNEAPCMLILNISQVGSFCRDISCVPWITIFSFSITPFSFTDLESSASLTSPRKPLIGKIV